jgi:hypothetical protein
MSKKLIILLIILGFITYHKWFSFSAFYFGDWTFKFAENLLTQMEPSVWSTYGESILWKYPYLFLHGLFGYFGFDSNISEKFLVFWQIALLAPVASFLFVKRITNSNIAGFIGSLVFSYSTYFLSIDTQGHQLLTVAFTWALFALTSFIYLLETNRKIFVPITALLLFVVGFYDLRSLYVVAGIITLYFIFHTFIIEKDIKKTVKDNLVKFISVFLLLASLSLYYLLPMIFAQALTSNEFLTRQLFGSEFYNIQNSITFFYPFWSGKETTWLQLQNIPIQFWLYPILAFAGLLIAGKNRKVIFFGALAILGIFLTKQEASPFPHVYTWLYENIPGFNAFREASKFMFITAVSYAVLIGVFADYVFNHLKNKKLAYLFVFLIALLPLINTVPLITGEIKTTFVPKTVPNDFVKLKNYILRESSYAKALGINPNRYYHYLANENKHLDLYYSLAHYWGFDVISYDFSDQSKTGAEKTVEFLMSEEGRRLLSNSSVGYVVIFVEDKQSNNNLRRDTGKNRFYYEEEFAKISYLKKINIGLENIVLYKNKNYKPHLYLTEEKETLEKDVPHKEIKHQMINSSEYRLMFNNISKPYYLNFTERYGGGRIRIGEFDWWKVLTDKNYFLPEQINSQSSIRFNQFYIDPKEFCNKDNCRIQNGSYSFEATLYAPSQSYLYLGLIISGLTLILVLGGIAYFYKKEKVK